MAKAKRRLCYVCETKPARTIESCYKHAIKEPAFCSIRCAAQFGLLIAGCGGEDDLHWCDEHGWYRGWSACEGCPTCPLPHTQEEE